MLLCLIIFANSSKGRARVSERKHVALPGDADVVLLGLRRRLQGDVPEDVHREGDLAGVPLPDWLLVAAAVVVVL